MIYVRNIHIWHSTVCDVQKHCTWTELQIDVEYVQ